METWWNVLKWVLIVLATGFVGYVGRFGAQWLIERARARRQAAQKSTPGSSPPAEGPPVPQSEIKDAQKAKKKRAKAQAKAKAKAEKKRAKGGS